MTGTSPRTGYAPVNGLDLYYEIHGNGAPLVLLHGGFGSVESFSELLPTLAARQQVIAVDLQGHGRTADIDRPIRYESMADDIAALIAHLGFGQATVLGYSLGGGVALQTAIRHPEVVDRLVVISEAGKRDWFYPEVIAGLSQVGAAVGELAKQAPIYQTYTSVAPRPEDWLRLWDRMGEMLRQDYDWSDGIAALTMPTMLVFGDADSVSPAKIAQFFGLLGGGKADGGLDGSGMSRHRLAILPGETHYNLLAAPTLMATIMPFLNAPLPEAS